MFDVLDFDTLDTIKAAWPALARALKSGQILHPQCKLVDPDPDVHAAYDVHVPIGNGVVLTCNVFRSKARMETGKPEPVVMCAHPYDNHITPALGTTPFGGPPQQYRLVPQPGGPPEFSTLTSWESPDPNFWIPAGYTLVNLNLSGYSNSGGEAGLASAQQGRDFYAAIKWIATQEWCDGQVGLTGVSHLAFSQYHAAVAAAADGDASPLKCISPWEGWSDLYRDVACRGGVPETGFLRFWWNTEVKNSLNNPREEFKAREGGLPEEMLQTHPLFDEHWAEKAANLAVINIPMLVCVSFSDHEMHTPGSYRAYDRAKSPRKWMYTHRTGKWSAFYSPEVSGLVRDFMDRHLKGIANRFDDLKPVRLEVRSDLETVNEVRWEDAWPLPSTQWRNLFLSTQGLVTERPAAAAEVSYDVKDGSASFELRFDEDTELSGHMALRLWVEVRPEHEGSAPPDDLILCVFVDKRDREGASVRFNGTAGLTEDMVTRGYVRASRRELDTAASTAWLPVMRGDTEHKLAPGEIVPVDIALCPSSTFFAAGESLHLIVSPSDIVHSPIFHKDTSSNAGRHVLHVGGKYDSNLLIPVIPTRTSA